MKIPKLRLSNEYSKGSQSARIKTAKGMNRKIFSTIYPMYKDSDTVSLRQIERTYKKCVPETIYFRIKKLLPEDLQKWEGGMITYFKNKKASGFCIAVKAEKNTLNIRELPTLMHESMHFFDYILNPNYVKIDEKLRDKNLKKIAYNLYNKYYYSNEYFSYFKPQRATKKAKQGTYKTINGMNIEDKCIIMNYIKLKMKTEINAFDESYKYSKQLKKDKRNHKWCDAEGNHKTFQFDKKLKLINKILYKEITKERMKMVLKNSTNLIDKIKYIGHLYTASRNKCPASI